MKEDDNMKTIPYKFIPEYTVKTGNMYYFGSLWSGSKTEESGIEILLSGQIETENEIITFTRGEINEEDFRNTIVKVVEIKKED